ncbi:diaminopropionate ammonia-lyase [Pararhodospirillum oryzae]|uniref:Diaminopropionate ammonia-lyase n=1 Tax=Pararhodospirillum oryzae TaxID=478448 RepID=A0A512H747_9PROT|nr:diaminopropionate ammonia-lyase [Pararhodospirillum oryzae]GEO81285.1 diaminopropionate ammonia-lyase [Pararhodospirillum oryzae]
MTGLTEFPVSTDARLLAGPGWSPDWPRHQVGCVGLTPDACGQAARVIRACPAYAPTPLRALPALARALGVARVDVKDEGKRLGVGSFKALGAPYALALALADRLGVTPEALLAGKERASCASFTAAAATDGNHGRAVAWGARQIGCKAEIFVPAAISLGRVRALEALGAQVVRGRGSYDQAVADCAWQCMEQGWLEITDTLSPGRVDPCIEVTVGRIMAGYSLIADEVLADLPQPPTHVLAQGGVGGLAAALITRLGQRLGLDAPRLIVVEPERAACLYASAVAGHPAPADGDLETLIAGLACGEVSVPAWEILRTAACAFVRLPDAAAIEAMRRLARPLAGDPAMVAGETGAAGMAGLLAVATNPAARTVLALDESSRVLVVATEEASDPDLYTILTGIPLPLKKEEV